MAEMEQMQEDITSITQERDQLLELLQSLREETLQLQKDLEEKDGMVKGKKHSLFFSLYIAFHAAGIYLGYFL